MREKIALSRHRRKPTRHLVGFTLIELMVVTVIMGILAALALPRFDSFRERAHYATIGQDFGNLAAAQERHYQLNLEYAVNLVDLDFTTSTGVQIAVTEASVQGWAATGTHQSLENTQGCGIYMGNAAAPNLPNGQPLTVGPGATECSQ